MLSKRIEIAGFAARMRTDDEIERSRGQNMHLTGAFFFFGTGTLHPRMIGWGTEDEGSIDEGKRTVRSCDYEVRKGAFMRKEDGGG
jgi:hypothetical protein